VLYSTSPYASAHLTAMAISYVARIPWVADFRDPWTDNPYRTIDIPSLRRLDRALESCVLSRADAIVCNTSTLQRTFCARSPAMATKCHTVANGIDFDLLGAVHSERPGSAGSFVFMHCGQFYGPRKPHALLGALRHLTIVAPDVARNVELVLVGPTRYQSESLAQLAGAFGVSDRVGVAGPQEHLRTLEYMQGSDALVLMGSAGAGSELQVPNKLYEYLGARRPILAALPPRSPAVDILRRSRAVMELCRPDDERDTADAMLRLIARASSPATDAWSGVAAFDRAKRAEELAAIFESIVRPRADRRRLLRSAAAAIDRPARRDSSAAPDRWSSPDRGRTAPASHPEVS
jgi:glycosyltransferase involved in cell wall biosynthesis